MISAILVCAGKGERANFGFNKLLKEIDGVPVFGKTLYAFSSREDVDEIIVVCSAADEDAFSVIAKKLGAKVTQEGVETRDDMIMLEGFGCDVIQGYYFAKPMKYVDFCEFVDTNFTK